ncbi:Uncharacterized protein BM_BM17970 [Brugia malayi]|uniref:Uncharacterized protein n=1 Tax=Brugia malayi TaxID=6279 RepID=A0A4E9EWJ2_BRUMA|nr:Uncharacterized protein BM_BM17970 [Brugia malayi]VIO87780.1 Uncharacterized protein BM_BM17970 [Brugia malayi]
MIGCIIAIPYDNASICYAFTLLCQTVFYIIKNCDKVAVVDVWSDTTGSDILRKAFVHTVRVMLLHFIAGILTWGTPVIHLQLLLANTCLGIINDKVFIKRLDLSFALTVVCDFLALLALLVQWVLPFHLPHFSIYFHRIKHTD